jgi:hypothetical protein
LPYCLHHVYGNELLIYLSSFFTCLTVLEFQKLAVDINNALSPSKGKEQRGNNKKQPSKRQKRAAGEAGDLETHAPNFEPEIQPHVQDTDVEQQPACTSQSPSPSNGTSKNEVRKRNKKQDLNRRKSLADAGLTWQAGVRRSTRIRSKPLQHWLGERFIYGRIHGSKYNDHANSFLRGININCFCVCSCLLLLLGRNI